MSSGYKVTITGINEEMDRGEVVSALARLFKKPPELLEKKMQGPPWVVKSELSLPEAEKYKEALEKAGTVCSIEKKEAMLSMERPESSQAHEPPQSSAPSPQKTCPKCGYQPFDDNDPLITAFDGEGECPNCGILVGRYLQKTAPQTESPVDPEAASVQVDSAGGNNKKIIFIAAIAVVAVVLGWYFLGGKDAPSTKPISKLAVKKAETTEPTEVSSATVCVLEPGETISVTMRGQAPFFHTRFQSAELDPLVVIGNNHWEDQGLKASVATVKLTPIDVDLWMLGFDGGVYNFPAMPKEEIKFFLPSRKVIVFKQNKGPIPNECIADHLVFTQSLKKYVELSQLPEDEFEKLVSDQKHAELKKVTYTAYDMDIRLSLSAPDGIADLDRKYSSRKGEIWVQMNSVLFEEGNIAGGVDFYYPIKLQGDQNHGEKSLTIRLPENNKYMLYNWSIDCE